MARIAILDDDPTMGVFYNWRLARTGHELVFFPDKEEFVRRACEVCPDVIITDLECPGMSGYTFLKVRSRYPCIKDVPVIVVSMAADYWSDYERQMWHAGTVAALDKLPTQEGLVAAVEKALSRDWEDD